MKAMLLTTAAMLTFALPASAQEHDHGAASTVTTTTAAPALVAENHQGHEGMDHEMMDRGQTDHGAMNHGSHAGHGQPTMSNMPAPKAPTDWAADKIHNPAEMEAARKALFKSTSDTISHIVLLDQLEWRSNDGRDAIAWAGKAWYGGDIDRLMIRSEGEAEIDGAVDKAEVRALWSHAIAPYVNLEMGVRHDIRPEPSRTYATIGMDGMLPYWIELESAFFLSDKGHLHARAELSHDMRLTQSLILQPRVEFNLAAQDVPELGIGSGLSDMELGLRLRYAAIPAFAPYLGVNWERKLGDTARYARAEGKPRGVTSLVLGVRFWF